MESFSGNIPTPSNGFNLKVEYEYTQDLIRRTTTITSIKGYVKRNNSSYYPSNSTQNTYLKISVLNDSNTYVEIARLKNTGSYNLNTNNYVQLVSGSNIELEHKTDSTQTMKIEFYVDGKLSSYYPKGSISKEIDLGRLTTPASVTGVTKTQSVSGLSVNDIATNLSIKTYTITATAGDNPISRYAVFHNGVEIGTSSTNTVQINFDGVNLINGDLELRVYDSIGVYGSMLITENLVLYNKPNLIYTSSNIKRNGQASGKVVCTLKGTFTNQQIGSTNNSIKNLQFKYWQEDTTEPGTYIDIPSGDGTTGYIVNNNEVSTSSMPMKNNGVEITDVDKSYGYYFKIKLIDQFDKVSEITMYCPNGEYVWAEYKDKVDFKEITRKLRVVGKANQNTDIASGVHTSFEIGDILICTGVENVAVNTANAVGSKSITFDKEFLYTPFVVASIQSNNTNNIFATATNITTTGCTLNYKRSTTTTGIPIHYIAIGVKK